MSRTQEDIDWEMRQEAIEREIDTLEYLGKIANALERIADALEKQTKG